MKPKVNEFKLYYLILLLGSDFSNSNPNEDSNSETRLPSVENPFFWM